MDLPTYKVYTLGLGLVETLEKAKPGTEIHQNTIKYHILWYFMDISRPVYKARQACTSIYGFSSKSVKPCFWLKWPNPTLGLDSS